MTASHRFNTLPRIEKTDPTPILLVTDTGIIDENLSYLLIPLLIQLKSLGYQYFLDDTCPETRADQAILEKEEINSAIQTIVIPEFLKVTQATKEFIDSCEEDNPHDALIQWLENCIITSTNVREKIFFEILAATFQNAPIEYHRNKSALKEPCNELPKILQGTAPEAFSFILPFHEQLKENTIEHMRYPNTEATEYFLELFRFFYAKVFSYHEFYKKHHEDQFEKLQKQNDAFSTLISVSTYLNLLQQESSKKNLEKFIIIYFYNIPLLQPGARKTPSTFNTKQVPERVEILRAHFNDPCSNGVKLDCADMSKEKIIQRSLEMIYKQLQKNIKHKPSVFSHGLLYKKPVKRATTVVCIGKTGVGKTNLCQFICENLITAKTDLTTKEDLTGRVLMRTPNNQLSVWDVSGENRYESLYPIYLLNAASVLITVDSNELDANNNIREYLDKIKRNCFPNVKILIAITRIDQRDEIYNVTKHVETCIKNWNDNPDNVDYQVAGYVETSAHENIGIDALRARLYESTKPISCLAATSVTEEFVPTLRLSF